MAVFRGPDDELDDEGQEREESAARRVSSRPPDEDLGRNARFWRYALQYFRRNRGKVIGVLLGLWVGVGVKEIGFWWTFFITFTVAVGYFVGKRLDESQEDLLEFLDRVLPPGRR